MSSLAIQRLESLLQTRKLDNTVTTRLVRPEGRQLSMGIDALDGPLGGGWPCGEVSELVGGRSSGRGSVLLATLAAATRSGGLVGLIDAFDRFDPLTAERVGVDLDRVLWVRGPSVTVEGLRPGAYVERAVLNAIRALDLILRAGGFSVVALDLADVPARALSALPFTTWLRLAHANEGRDTVCVIVGDQPMGRSAGGVSVRLDGRRCWTGTHAQSRRFAGFDLRLDVVSARAARFEWPAGPDRSAGSHERAHIRGDE
jgi:hypothetical protein